jgi:hypothetical protein
MGTNRLLPPVECPGFANGSEAEFRGLWKAHPAKNESGDSQHAACPQSAGAAVAAKASFVDSSGHADRNFIFTGGRKDDSNETAATKSSTK